MLAQTGPGEFPDAEGELYTPSSWEVLDSRGNPRSKKGEYKVLVDAKRFLADLERRQVTAFLCRKQAAFSA